MPITTTPEKVLPDVLFTRRAKEDILRRKDEEQRAARREARRRAEAARRAELESRERARFDFD